MMGNIFKRFIDRWRVGLIRNHSTNKEWDEILNGILSHNKIKEIDDFYATFDNGVKVWIGSRYYAYGYPQQLHGYLPSPSTAIRLHKAILAAGGYVDRKSKQLKELEKLKAYVGEE